MRVMPVSMFSYRRLLCSTCYDNRHGRADFLDYVLHEHPWLPMTDQAQEVGERLCALS